MSDARADNVNIVDKCLESLACQDESIVMDRTLLVQTSIAVSLKRIADALTAPSSDSVYWSIYDALHQYRRDTER
jgi:hypothetical protein